jgi:hypothetical protein
MGKDSNERIKEIKETTVKQRQPGYVVPYRTGTSGTEQDSNENTDGLGTEKPG